MKKIVNWKIYDTEKSELISKSWKINIYLITEEDKELLYKTKKWEYFLYCFHENGLDDELWIIWEQIKLLNLYEILKWFEKNQKNITNSDKELFLKEFWKYYFET